MNSGSRHFVVAILAFLLTACGGGGGGGSSSTPVSSSGPSTPAAPSTPEAPASSPALTFTPGTVTANWVAGSSATLNINVKVNRPSDFSGSVYAFLIDQTGVILPTGPLSPPAAEAYILTLQTSPSLSPGQYKGNFTVKLCRDANCAQQFPGSPMLLPYDFQVAKQPFNIFANGSLDVTLYGGASPVKVSASVSAANRTWSASSTVAWAKLDQSGGSGNGTVAVTYDASGLAPGKYTGELDFTSSDDQKVAVPISLQVLASAFQISQSQISFNAINGAPIAPQVIHIGYEGGINNGWSAASNVGWLGVNPASSNAPGDATLSITESKSMTSGAYNGQLTLSSPLNATRTLPVQLNLVAPTLSVTSPSLTFGGSLGRDPAPQSTLFSLNTQGNAWPLTLSGLPAWVSAPTSASVSQAVTQINFAPLADNAAVGSTTATVNATVTVNGDVITKPVTLTINKDQHKLVPSEVGVGLVSTPQWSRLTRTLTVSDTFGSASAWSASSNSTWLAVRASGSQLVLTADPSALPQDTVSYATVTLTTTAAGVTTPEPIRVALWKGSAAPSAIRKLNVNYSNIVADPIRPLVYAHSSGASTVDVYNVYTGALVGTSAALGAALGDMAVAPNGDYLYVTDTANRALVKVALPSLTRSAVFAVPSLVDTSVRVLSVRPSGAEIVLLSNGIALAAGNGRVLSTTLPSHGMMAAPPSGKALYSIDSGYSPASLGGARIDYSEMGGGTLFVLSQIGAAFSSAGSNGADVAVGRDGQRVYTASGAPYQCASFQASDLSAIGYLPGGEPYPNNVEVGSDGRIYCGINGIYSKSDVWVYAADGTLLNSFKFVGYAKGLLPRQMVVSADGLVLVALTDDPLMAIVPVGP